MNIICKRNGLVVRNVNEHSIHGISYIFEIGKTDGNVSGNTSEVIIQETNRGLYSNALYKHYKLKCLQYKSDLTSKVIQYRIQNKQVIAFGSTAKSMTVLNFCGLTSEFIDFMIDESPYKESLYTPGSNILVCPISGLKKIEKECVIMITAWNFYDEIKSKIQKYVVSNNIPFSITLLNIDNLTEEIV